MIGEGVAPAFAGLTRFRLMSFEIMPERAWPAAMWERYQVQ